MPVFADYRRFPHIDSYVSERAKYNVFTSQLHRFAIICNTWQSFRQQVTKLAREMIEHGYAWQKLRHGLIKFWRYYQDFQRVHHGNYLPRAQQQIGRLAREVDLLAAHLRRME